MFNLDKRAGVVSKNYSAISEIMKLPSGSKRYVCVGVYIDENGQEQLFVPKMTFSVFHGDTELIGNTDTIGYADIPVGKLPEDANGPTGFKTDARGIYIFYTAKDGKEVKIYYNADTLVPEGAKAYKVVNGFLPNGSIDKFSGVGMSAHGFHGELLSKNIDSKTLGLLE